MKKVFTFLFISFVMVTCFAVAREPSKIFSTKDSFSRSWSVSQKFINKAETSTWKIKFSSGTKIPFQLPISDKKSLKTWLCITWDQLLVRDQLSSKAQKASETLFSLLQIAAKLSYPTEKISMLAKDFQNLSSQIKKDCSPRDFKLHRDQIKTRLDVLKDEIARLKLYIVRLRNR